MKVLIIIGLIAYTMTGCTNSADTSYDVDDCMDGVHDRTGIDINDRKLLAEIGGC